jgi:hypothetical protein
MTTTDANQKGLGRTTRALIAGLGGVLLVVGIKVMFEAEGVFRFFVGLVLAALAALCVFGAVSNNISKWITDAKIAQKV